MQEFEELDCLTGWPVLPTADGIASLVPLQASSLVWEPDTAEGPAPALSALQKLGIRWAIALAHLGISVPEGAMPCSYCPPLMTRRAHCWVCMEGESVTCESAGL